MTAHRTTEPRPRSPKMTFLSRFVKQGQVAQEEVNQRILAHSQFTGVSDIDHVRENKHGTEEKHD